MVARKKSKAKSALDVPAGLIWVDGIRRPSSGWEFETICVRNRRVEKASMPFATGITAPLMDVRAPFYDIRDTDIFDLEINTLSPLDVAVDPADLLRPLKSDIKVTDRHKTYRVTQAEGYDVWVPALLLIRALFLGSKSLERALFTPNGAALLGYARKVNRTIEVTPGPGYYNPNNYAALPTRIGWLQLSSDARRCHGSILHFARSGALALEPLEVSLKCAARGLRIGGCFLAVELNAIELDLSLDADEISMTDNNGRRRVWRVG